MIENERLAAPLKRCPDTNHSFFRNLLEGSKNLGAAITKMYGVVNENFVAPITEQESPARVEPPRSPCVESSTLPLEFRYSKFVASDTGMSLGPPLQCKMGRIVNDQRDHH